MNATGKQVNVFMSKIETVPNGANLMTAERQLLIDGLNQDLAREFQAIMMYIHYSAKLTGPYRRELRSLFKVEIGAKQAHVQFLADKISAMGGENIRFIQVPPARLPRDMLIQALKAGIHSITAYAERIPQAAALGDKGLRVHLENHMIEATRHKEKIEDMLAGWDEITADQVESDACWQDDGGQG